MHKSRITGLHIYFPFLPPESFAHTFEHMLMYTYVYA